MKLQNSAVIASIRPKFCWLIENRSKMWELRTSYPKLDTPFKVYIYCTLGGSKEFFQNELEGNIALWNRDRWWERKGKVIGEFICDRIETAVVDGDACCMSIIEQTGLTREEVLAYGKGKTVYAWHISELVMYDRAKEIDSFTRICPAYGKDIGKCWDCLMAVGEEHDCGTNGLLYVEKAPQSWCYVGGQCFE